MNLIDIVTYSRSFIEFKRNGCQVFLFLFSLGSLLNLKSVEALEIFLPFHVYPKRGNFLRIFFVQIANYLEVLSKIIDKILLSEIFSPAFGEINRD